MVILAFDTSTSQGGVAVLSGDQVLSRKIWVRQGSHGELLTPTIETCLQEAGVKASELSALAVGQGPGSFTGVRIAINASRTLSFALNKPVFVFDTTEVLAAGAPRTDLPVLTLVNAHKNLLYASTFEHSPSLPGWTRVAPLEARSLEEIEKLIQTPHLCLGDGFLEYEKSFSPRLASLLVREVNNFDFPQPEVLARLAQKSKSQPLDWKSIQALYIRASGAEEKLAEDRKK